MFKVLFATILFSVSLISHGADFVAGKDYEVLNKANKNSHQVVNITEFFSFGCPWCFRVEPAVDHWVEQHKNDIRFKKIPVVFNKDWEYYAKAYYAAEALSLNSTINPALFKAILTDKTSLNNDQAMIDFFVKQGVTPEIAKSAFTQSPSIELSIKHGLALMARDHITAVPAFVVNGQYKTDLQMAKTEERLFEILDFLISLSNNTELKKQ